MFNVLVLWAFLLAQGWAQTKSIEIPRLTVPLELGEIVQSPGFQRDAVKLMQGLSSDSPVRWALFEVGEALLTEFPTDQYLYVFLGRSGAGLARALQVILLEQGYPESFVGEQILELPMTGLGQGPIDPRFYQIVLQKHFELHWPQNTHGRRILLLDYVHTGRTIVNFHAILGFLESGGFIQKNVEYLGLVGQTKSPDLPLPPMHFLRLPPMMGLFFQFLAFKEESKYYSWDFRDMAKEYDFAAGDSPQLEQKYIPPKLRVKEFRGLDALLNFLNSKEPKNLSDEGLRTLYQELLARRSCEQLLK